MEEEWRTCFQVGVSRRDRCYQFRVFWERDEYVHEYVKPAGRKMKEILRLIPDPETRKKDCTITKRLIAKF